MESVASNSTPPPSNNNHRFRQTQPVADRIVRALRHHLRLLHRTDSTFFILGATGNVYMVTLTTNPTCTCPDRTTPCKHILFVLIRVLGVSLDDTCLRRRTLRPCQLSRLLRTPTFSESLAGPTLRQRFHQLYFYYRQSSSSSYNSRADGSGSSRAAAVDHQEIEEGTVCPVCLEEIAFEKEDDDERGGGVVACGTCRNVIHEECLMRWKKSRGRRPAICVICRARWRDIRGGDHKYRYLNLAAYVNEDDTMLIEDNNRGDNISFCGS